MDVARFFQGKANFYIHSLEATNVPALVQLLSNDFEYDDLGYPRVIAGGNAKPNYSVSLNL